MKKFGAFVKTMAILWMTLIVAATMLLLFPIFVILPESWKEKICDKLEPFCDWITDRLNGLTKEL